LREIQVPDPATIVTLSNLTEISTTRLIQTAFEDMGRLLTIYDPLPFDESRALLVHFGYDARRAS
jgi:hypothetical protein